MKIINRAVCALTLSMLLGVVVVGVNSCKKADDAVDEVIDSYLEDLYASNKGLTIDFAGDQATITEFGSSDLGSNKSAIDVGDIYVKNIKRTGPNKWTADIIEGDYYLSSLKSVTFVSTDVTLNGTELFFSNPDKWDITWKKATTGTGTGAGTGTGTGTGNGNGNGNNPTAGDTIYNEVIEGDSQDEIFVRFNIPAGIKTLTVIAAETGPGEKNSADMFVNKGSDPVITSKSPYTYNALCAGTKPNRETEICTFSNPGSGQWSVMLYGYNTYFFSRLMIITNK